MQIEYNETGFIEKSMCKKSMNNIKNRKCKGYTVGSLNIDDIARLAGVSKSTVSRVLNNPALVSELTQKKVNSIIEEHDFYPNHAARTLSNRSSGIIAVIVSEINNEYFGNLLLGIAEVTDDLGLTMMIFNTDNSYKKEKKIFEALRGYYVEGILYTPSIKYNSKIEEKHIADFINKINVPIILMDREMQYHKYDGVYFNDLDAMYEATKIFIEKGHKKIGIVSGDFEGSLISNRDDGVYRAMCESGLKLNHEDILRCDYSVEAACDVTLERFKRPNPPTAFLLGNNHIALGFLKAINKMKMKLNIDVECIGIDKIPSIDYIDYGYSFIERDSKYLGIKAMELLLDKIDNPEEQVKSIFLPAPVNYKMKKS